MITIEQMIQREVLCCMSSLISTLAQSYKHDAKAGNALSEIQEQASELAAAVLDYEEAAIQEGWEKVNDLGWYINRKNGRGRQCKSWEDLCTTEQYAGDNEIEPYFWEVYEHWAVTRAFAHKLRDAGEKVDMDFAGLDIWARTTTGQAIRADDVVQKIYREMVK